MKIKTVLDVTGSHTDQYAKYGVGNYGCAVFDCEPTEQQIKECLANGQGVERANGKFYPPEGWGDERQEMENQPKVSNIIAFAIALLVILPCAFLFCFMVSG